MGDYIIIEETISPFDFLCCSVTTGTPFIARVDDDKRDYFMSRTWIEQHPTACEFLRPIGDRFICTIHETSPIQCKAYRCSIMQIFSPDSKLLGKVTGTLALHTDDKNLRLVWEDIERKIDKSATDVENQIYQLLGESGYRIV